MKHTTTQTESSLFRTTKITDRRVFFDGGLSKIYEGFDWIRVMNEAHDIINAHLDSKGEWNCGRYYWEASEDSWRGKGKAPQLTLTYWEDIDNWLIGIVGDRVKDGYYYPCHADYQE